MFSFWENNSYFNNIDYLIVGAGIVGLSSAIYLKQKQPHVKILVIDKGILPNGASTKNAGFACIGSPTEILSDLENHSEEEVLNILKKRWNGLQNLIELVGKKNMNYIDHGGYELYQNQDIYSKVQDKISCLNQLTQEATQCKDWYQWESNKYSFNSIEQLAYMKHEGQINPMMMMMQLYKNAINLGINILNNIDVISIDAQNNLVSTRKQGNINAKNILVCTNAFTKQLIPDLNIIPARNQVLMTKPIPNLSIKGCFHFNEGYIYFRNYNNRILLGGARHTAIVDETTTEFGNTEFIKNQLIQFLNHTILPNQSFEIEQWWSGIIAVGGQKTPIVKKVSEGIYVAARLSGIGVAIGSSIAKDLINFVTEE